MLKGAPKRYGGGAVRDILVAYVKAHQPLTAELLGAASTGKPRRFVQIGSRRMSE